eukprot:Rhum_TRINITY_DN4298_c0_g1::Rhum_TRINITY_DN4298_c0_g1_i1::g.13383::m.13383
MHGRSDLQAGAIPSKVATSVEEEGACTRSERRHHAAQYTKDAFIASGVVMEPDATHTSTGRKTWPAPRTHDVLGTEEGAAAPEHHQRLASVGPEGQVIRSGDDTIHAFTTATPWRPSGTPRTFDAEVTVTACAPFPKLARAEEEAIVKRLHDQSITTRNSSFQKLVSRHCQPREKGRVLRREEMGKQYEANMNWGKRVQQRLEAQWCGKNKGVHHPKPPADGDAVPSTMSRPYLQRSVSRLHKGLRSDSDTSAHHDTLGRLYSKYGVCDPPPTMVYTARGT